MLHLSHSARCSGRLSPQAALTQQYIKMLPTLCLPSFKADAVRLELDTRAVADWNEVDFIELVGSDALPPGILDSSLVRVWLPGTCSALFIVLAD